MCLDHSRRQAIHITYTYTLAPHKINIHARMTLDGKPSTQHTHTHTPTRSLACLLSHSLALSHRSLSLFRALFQKKEKALTQIEGTPLGNHLKNEPCRRERAEIDTHAHVHIHALTFSSRHERAQFEHHQTRVLLHMNTHRSCQCVCVRTQAHARTQTHTHTHTHTLSLILSFSRSFPHPLPTRARSLSHTP